jgi:hydrogenase nickel incorporation protein HypA/HybF
MHEYGIVQALIERAGVEAALRSALVRRLHVRIGELAGVDPELLTTAFETFRERGPCAGAELCVTPVVAEWRCRHCGEPITRGARLRCAACQAPAQLTAGDEIILDRIELEVPDV